MGLLNRNITKKMSIVEMILLDKAIEYEENIEDILVKYNLEMDNL